MEGNMAPPHPSRPGADVGRGEKKNNSEALLFRDFSLKVADVAGGNRDTVWAAGLLTELTLTAVRNRNLLTHHIKLTF